MNEGASMTIYTQAESDRKFRKRYDKLKYDELVQKISEWEDKVVKLRELLKDRFDTMPRC